MDKPQEHAINPEDLTEKTSSANTEESLPEGHNPDMGEPEQRAGQAPDETPEQKALRESAEWKDKYFRLYAEFDNFRKRSQRERVELLQSAGSDVIKELLPVMDNFERAVKANETVEDITAVKEGFVLIYQNMLRRLESRGVKAMETNGQPFDVDVHEAITNIPSPTPDLKGKVVDTVEKGYTYNDKVLRFAKVVVGA
ncbi:MAG: nucleotide exchange factor GrpE [Flavobacteriales bacterium]|jgi:molecular chaperone GrpE